MTLALLLAIVPATPALAAAVLDIVPDEGEIGDTIDVYGAGFTLTTVYIYFSSVKAEVDEDLEDEVAVYELVKTNVTVAAGEIDTFFTVPDELTDGDDEERVRAGTYWVYATNQLMKIKARDKFTVVGVGQIILDPEEGVVGTEVEVTGTDFGEGEAIIVEYDGADITDDIDGEDDTGSAGEFEFTISIPESTAGDHTITVTGDDSELEATAEFTVESEITISPESGAAGETVTVGGTGFGRSSDFEYIEFDGDDIDIESGDDDTDSNGSFEFTFIVPAADSGTYDLEVEDEDGNYGTVEFTIAPVAASLSINTGYVGTEVTVSGTGFQASKSITITFDNTGVATASADAYGGFSASFNAPARIAGTYKVGVSDGTNTVEADFSLVAATASLSTNTGYVGTEVTVSGTGFRTSKSIPVIFDNESVTIVSTDAYGSFSASFNVPSRIAGTYSVVISDGISTVKADFSISTSTSISPATSAASPGYVGSKVTLSGVGFMSGKLVTVTYDGKQVATAAVNTDGTFSATFSAPASTSGEHSIIATGLTNPISFTFVMESTPPSIPQPLKPEMDVKVEAEAYFDWEDVTDPSGVTYTLQVATSEGFSVDSIVLDKTGLTQSEYAVTQEEKLRSVSKETPYYWRVKAIDKASNEGRWSGDGSFYVGFTLALPRAVIYTLFGVGALLLGVFGFWLGRKTAYY